MDILHLNWTKDRDGYNLDVRKPKPTGKRQARLLSDSGGTYIVRRSGMLLPTTPLRTQRPWRILADTAPTPEGALGFVEAFGFLHQRKVKEQLVAEIIEAINSMRRLLDLGERQDWATIGDWLNRAGEDSAFGIGGIGKMGVVFAPHEGMARPRLSFRPGSLISALYVQALMDLTEGVDLYKCERPGCGQWFPRGGGRPHHRVGARYCSPTCQKAHQYSKNQKQKGEAR